MKKIKKKLWKLQKVSETKKFRKQIFSSENNDEALKALTKKKLQKLQTQSFVTLNGNDANVYKALKF